MNSSAVKDAWYPLLESSELKPKQLLTTRLFGEPLVFFRDEQKQPICVQDRCPHRSTPLSIGKVRDGRLVCCYHGWEFGANGQCLKIPSEPSNKKIPQTAHASYKACIEKHGLIWVWAGDPAAADESRMLGAPLSILDNPDYYFYHYVQDIDIPHELMVENLLDPAHLPFAHEGTLSRMTPPQAISIEVVTEDADIGGIVHYENPSPVKNALRFFAPCMVRIDLIFDDKRQYQQIYFCVPRGPGELRLVCMFVSNAMKRAFNNRFGRRFSDFMVSKVVGQDVTLLLAQQANLAQGAAAWQAPVGADRLAIMYRKWFDENFTADCWFSGFGSTGKPARRASAEQ